MMPLNNWIIKKIAEFLAIKEGCITKPIEGTADGAKVVIQDSFGFRYELHLRALSRISGSFEEKESLADYKQEVIAAFKNRT